MGRRLLVVEGKNDQHVMWNLFEDRGIPELFSVELPDPAGKEGATGSVETLIDSVPARLRTAELECLAIVVDANGDADARWRSIRDHLVAARIEGVPKVHGKDGTVVQLLLPPEPRKPVRFGVWMMPDNRSTGILEDFVAKLIPEDDDMLVAVDGFLDSIEKQKKQRFKSAHLPKARIHSWLAVQEEPGKPMGQAIKARYLDTDREVVDSFFDWINNALIN